MYDHLNFIKKCFKLVVNEFNEYLSWFIFSWPGKTGNIIRLMWAKIALKICGNRISLGSKVQIRGSKNISIMDDVKFDEQCYLDARGGTIFIGGGTMFNRCVNINASIGGKISFGSNCIIGPNVLFRTSNHNYSKRDFLIKEQGHNSDKIIICNDVWIGAAAVILPGVSLNDGCIVGAGSIVTKSVPAYHVVAGNPARFIKER